MNINTTRASFQGTLDFYLVALAPLGYQELMRPVPDVVGLGADGVPDFWISIKEQDAKEVIAPVHIAFAASSKWDLFVFFLFLLRMMFCCVLCLSITYVYVSVCVLYVCVFVCAFCHIGVIYIPISFFLNL